MDEPQQPQQPQPQQPPQPPYEQPPGGGGASGSMVALGIGCVVIVVLLFCGGILMALLVPAIMAARESARRVQCMNNQKQVSLASLNFEAVNGEFPGYKNTLDVNEVHWAVMLFPYLERTRLWEEWAEGHTTDIYMKVLICPSDLPEQISPGGAPMSYICNTQIFLDCDGRSIDYVSRKDGVATTLMLSERILPGSTLGAREWASLDPAPEDVGFSGTGTMGDELTSRHGNGVIAAFCDGHIQFLRNDISDAIYQQLCGPDDGGMLDESEIE